VRFPGVAVILAILGVLLISSGVAPVGTVDQSNDSPSSAMDAESVVGRSPEVQRSVGVQGRDRDAVLSLLLLLGMYEGRHAR
jgi:hypothetical protein